MHQNPPNLSNEGFQISSQIQYENFGSSQSLKLSPWQDASWTRVLEFFSPGRVNLIGEHMDYNGGLSLPFAINLGICFVLEQAAPSSTKGSDDEPFFIAVTMGHGKHMAILQQSPSMTAASTKYDLSYLNGAWQIATAEWPTDTNHVAQAYRIRISSNLPTGAGLSSSAAYSLGLLICFAQILGVKKLQPGNLARLAQRVEHEFAGTPCGLMDQITILQTPDYGFLELDFGAPLQSADTRITGIPAITKHSFAAIGSRWCIALFQTGRKHKLSDGSYETRRRECETAASLLASFQSKHSQQTQPTVPGVNSQAAKKPQPRTLGELGAFWEQQCTEPDLLGSLLSQLEDPLLQRRSQFVFAEIARARSTIRAIANGDLVAIDNNLGAAQDGLRSDYEVSCSEVDLAVSLIRSLKANLPRYTVMGPRMMGGGWGGSLILLIDKASKEKVKKAFQSLIQTYDKSTGCRAELIFTEPHHGLIYERELLEKFTG